MDQHGQHRPLVKPLTLATGILALLACEARAEGCRLALVLALDISSSVDPKEDALQRQGLSSALTSPEVQRAIFMPGGHVALAVFEWSGRYNQELLLDWTEVRNPTELTQAAHQVGASKRSFAEFPTAVGHALEFAAELHARAPDCLFQTVDISGDGQNNEGPRPLEIYEKGILDNVTVNGLVINAAEFEAETELIYFFESEVLHGPGAFLEVAEGFADFERAMRRKLERELTPATLSHAPATTERPKG
jgi:hypothetical protein